jgi:hypothetical protein
MHRRRPGFTPPAPYRKRRHRARVAERRARRRDRDLAVREIAVERSVHTATAPLTIGPALIVILVLSLGMWALIWAAVRLVLAAL